jgi:hypothetical protein
MNTKTIWFATAALAAGALWYAFRPELLFVDAKVDEGLHAATRVVRQGTFHAGAHETRGVAAIHAMPDGKQVLRLTDFATSNGPDLHVLLVAADDAKDSDTVKTAGYVAVSKLKGNVGDQNYELPDNVDLTRHRAVTIWCNRFGVNFGTAPLVQPKT